MNESENVIDLTLNEEDVTETVEEDDESHPIMIESEEESKTSSDENTTLISSKLKDQYLDKAIAFYKAKCKQYIKQRKAKCLANYLKQQAKDIVKRSLGYPVEELSKKEMNLALYLTYLGEVSMFE